MTPNRTRRHLFPRVLDVQDGDDRPAASITMERLRGVTLSHLLTGRALTSGRLTRMMAALEAVHSCPPSGAAAEQPPLNIYGAHAFPPPPSTHTTPLLSPPPGPALCRRN